MKAALVFLAFCLWWGLHILLSLCKAAKRDPVNFQESERMRNTTFDKWAGGDSREPVSTNRSLPSGTCAALTGCSLLAIQAEKRPNECEPEPMAVCQQASPENNFGVSGGVESRNADNRCEGQACNPSALSVVIRPIERRPSRSSDRPTHAFNLTDPQNS